MAGRQGIDLGVIALPWRPRVLWTTVACVVAVLAVFTFGIVAGSRVQFEYEGRLYSGIVNRVTKRATILVEDPGGLRYSDGKRYTKFYIPLDHLLPERKSG